MLLLPGLAMIFGGIKHKEQCFNSKSAGVSSVLLIISAVGMPFDDYPSTMTITTISVLSSYAMVFRGLHAHHFLRSVREPHAELHWVLWGAELHHPRLPQLHIHPGQLTITFLQQPLQWLAVVLFYSFFFSKIDLAHDPMYTNKTRWTSLPRHYYCYTCTSIAVARLLMLFVAWQTPHVRMCCYTTCGILGWVVIYPQNTCWSL